MNFRLVTRSLASLNGDVRPISHWYNKIRAFDLPKDPSGVIMKSRQVRLSRESREGMYKGYAGITAYHFSRAQTDMGTLTLKEGGLSFSGAAGSIELPLNKILGVTIESNTIIIISPSAWAPVL